VDIVDGVTKGRPGPSYFRDNTRRESHLLSRLIGHIVVCARALPFRICHPEIAARIVVDDADDGGIDARGLGNFDGLACVDGPIALLNGVKEQFIPAAVWFSS